MRKHSILAVGINSTPEEKINIQRKLKIENITLDTASIKDIFVRIVDSKITVLLAGKDLKRYDYVLIQSGWTTTHMAYLLHLYLKSQNIPHNKTNTHTTKLSDIFFLASKGVPVPNTFFHNGLKINNESKIDIQEICKLPCIYKTLLGSLGSRVHLIDSMEDIEGTVRENGKYNKYIFQEFISNDFDYRVVVANNQVSSVCIRTRVSDKYRNNVSLGATEEFISIQDTPIEVLDMAIEASKALKLNWAGVDIVTDNKTNRNYVLEVNRRPGLTGKSTEIGALYSYIKQLT
ncbi:MAG: ATP-grasp domain-containing protein [Candidatus Dojkabacteria bacterium]|jgi:ribosomal protein S6--L-glutamate ligase|nr:ATP-grasp domain-containing protein [Candidatus Dojkabacteria bacterium]